MPSDLAAKSNVYRFLGRLWSREVDGPVVALLRSGELADAYRAAGGVGPGEGDDPIVLEALALDYCQLFVGPSHPLPPYQSVWTSGQFQGGPVASMERYFDVLGYRPPWTDSTRHRIETGQPRKLMLDHLGIQLDGFGHALAALSALGEGNEAVEHGLREVASSFFRDHLTWPGRLLRVARARAGTDFYRGLIAVTDEFLAAEAGEWAEVRPDPAEGDG